MLYQTSVVYWKTFFRCVYVKRKVGNWTNYWRMPHNFLLAMVWLKYCWVSVKKQSLSHSLTSSLKLKVTFDGRVLVWMQIMSPQDCFYCWKIFLFFFLFFSNFHNYCNLHILGLKLVEKRFWSNNTLNIILVYFCKVFFPGIYWYMYYMFDFLSILFCSQTKNPIINKKVSLL